jgi:DNA-binding HxlR family transcriptional regulator
VEGVEFSAENRKVRAGAHVLQMAADPINRKILRRMLDHPVKAGAGHYEVTPVGREALFVGFVIERWLQSAPQGPLAFESKEAEAAVAALAEGWSAAVVHMLARGPHGFDELREAVEPIGRRALKRRLEPMQRTGQVEALPDGAGGQIYAATDWLRAAIAPLIAAARLERRDPREEMAPIDTLDVEAGFRLSLPLLELPAELSGSCSLGFNLLDDPDSPLTGVTARVEEGRVVSCTAGLDRKADAWAAATGADWLDTVIEPDAKRVRTGGDRRLAGALLAALHKHLFGVPVA